MTPAFNWIRMLLATGALGALSIGAALAQTITISPDTLNLETNAAGSLTATLSEAAPSGGLSLLISATPGLAVQVPTSVLVPAGDTSVSFSVIATAAPGTEEVAVSASGYVGDSATVVVVAPTSDSGCRKSTGDATHAARAYIKALGVVDRLCVKAQPSCASALSQAYAALDAVTQANSLVFQSCQ